VWRAYCCVRYDTNASPLLHRLLWRRLVLACLPCCIGCCGGDLYSLACFLDADSREGEGAGEGLQERDFWKHGGLPMSLPVPSPSVNLAQFLILYVFIVCILCSPDVLHRWPCLCRGHAGTLGLIWICSHCCSCHAPGDQHEHAV
jgi:hypothetical protein